MIYRNYSELKARMRRLRITQRLLALHLEMPPGTLSNQLGGWAPLSEETAHKIREYLEQNEVNLLRPIAEPQSPC